MEGMMPGSGKINSFNLVSFLGPLLPTGVIRLVRRMGVDQSKEDKGLGPIPG